MARALLDVADLVRLGDQQFSSPEEVVQAVRELLASGNAIAADYEREVRLRQLLEQTREADKRELTVRWERIADLERRLSALADATDILVALAMHAAINIPQGVVTALKEAREVLP